MLTHAKVLAPCLLITAVASGQGKTSVTAALARKFRKMGKRVRVFKVGPDFLDPMMLERAVGEPVDMLDLWIVGEHGCRTRLAAARLQYDVVLIEAVMGLYDGQPSSADLARALDVSVVAVIDASAMAQTAGAVAMGLRDFGPVKLVGIIANRVAGDGHANYIAQAMRDIPLLAYLPRLQRGLPERHLGLVQPDDIEALDALLDMMADQIVTSDALHALLNPVSLSNVNEVSTEADKQCGLAGRVVAIARDAAFAFIHPANLDWLNAAGARVKFFSPLADEPIPADAQSVILPGGYPELHGESLSRAQNWQRSIRSAHASGMPIWAECGGMMALAGALVDLDGRSWAMSELLPGVARMQQRLVALGPQIWRTQLGDMRGHSFHFSEFETAVPSVWHTRSHPDGRSIEAVYQRGNLIASYFHAYYPSCPALAGAILTGNMP